MTTTYLSRDVLLGATDVPTEDVTVPELGGVVKVRGMTSSERGKFEQSCFEGRGRRQQFNWTNARAKMVSLCCIDDQGHRLFTDEDADQLGQVRADVLNRLFTVAQRLSGMSDEEVEELGKSFELTAASATSSSVSPSNSA